MIRIVYGFPLSAYYPCSEYECIFFSAIEPGRHYYEGKANKGVEFTDWNQLPPVTPQSLLCLDEIPVAIKEQVSKVRDLYERARAVKVLNDEVFKGKIVICAPKRKELRNINMLLDEGNALAFTLEESELDRADEMLQKIREISLELYPTEMWILQDGDCSIEEIRISIQKDHFVYSPVYQMKVEQILEQISKVETRRKNVEKCLTDAISKITAI